MPFNGLTSGVAAYFIKSNVIVIVLAVTLRDDHIVATLPHPAWSDPQNTACHGCRSNKVGPSGMATVSNAPPQQCRSVNSINFDSSCSFRCAVRVCTCAVPTTLQPFNAPLTLSLRPGRKRQVHVHLQLCSPPRLVSKFFASACLRDSKRFQKYRLFVPENKTRG